jgi:hypothetical protein
MSEVSEKTLAFVDSADKKLNEIAGWADNALVSNLVALIKHGRVEVGYRAQCGSTHHTQNVWREWVRLIKKLRADGFEITETPVRHGNAYATSKGGFWQSTIFEVQP